MVILGWIAGVAAVIAGLAIILRPLLLWPLTRVLASIRFGVKSDAPNALFYLYARIGAAMLIFVGLLIIAAMINYVPPA